MSKEINTKPKLKNAKVTKRSNKETSEKSQAKFLPIMPPVVLSFGGSDPTTASGIQADIQTISSIGCYPTSVLTAITVQDTVGVSEIHGLSPDIVLRQAQAILEDVSVSAFKIGLVGNADCAKALGDLLDNYDEVPLIFSPVLTTAAGEDFVSDEILEAIFEDLISQTTIITLSLNEARRLCEFNQNEDFSNAKPDKCADVLLNQGCEYVLINSFDSNIQKYNHYLYHHLSKSILTLQSSKLPDEQMNVEGTLSSAIAGYMAHGIEITTAIKLAQTYSWESFNNGLRLGMGKTLPNRMYWRVESTGLPLNTIGEQILNESKLENNYPGN